MAVSLFSSACATRPELREPTVREVVGEEALLLSRVRLYEDPDLAAYLRRLVQQVGDVPLTVRVIRDPTLAAFALPSSGVLYVHTGLLTVAESEGQLVSVLAHEGAHVSRLDALEKGGADALEPRLGLAAVSRTAVAIFGLKLPLIARAAITGYGATRERTADATALDALERAGRDPRNLLAMYEALAAQAARAGAREVFYFGNAARLAERVESARAMLASRPAREASATARGDEFERQMRPVVLDNAYEEIRAGRFDLATRQLDRAASAGPDDPRLHLYYGELYRLQAQHAATDAEQYVELVQARTAYERAIALDPGMAEAHRQLGLLYYGMRDVERARAELEQYLALAPSAPDRARVSEYVQELSR